MRKLKRIIRKILEMLGVPKIVGDDKKIAEYSKFIATLGEEKLDKSRRNKTMNILETSKLKQEANVILNSTDMVRICNALYEYENTHKVDEGYNILQARMILAREMTQYGLVDGFGLDRIRELTQPNEEVQK